MLTLPCPVERIQLLSVEKCGTVTVSVLPDWASEIFRMAGTRACMFCCSFLASVLEHYRVPVCCHQQDSCDPLTLKPCCVCASKSAETASCSHPLQIHCRPGPWHLSCSLPQPETTDKPCSTSDQQQAPQGRDRVGVRQTQDFKPYSVIPQQSVSSAALRASHPHGNISTGCSPPTAAPASMQQAPNRGVVTSRVPQLSPRASTLQISSCCPCCS